MAGIYIHIPFCKSRCAYCDFYSTLLQEEWKLQYLHALEREFKERQNETHGTLIHTIYIGGGTPSQLPLGLLSHLFGLLQRYFSISPQAEVTIEANPDDINEEWLTHLHTTAVNRISMGVQSFHDYLLETIHRRHTSQQALQAIEYCINHGYRNLSIDLIYGLPNETLDEWKEDLRCVANLPITHLSAYALQYEEGTRLFRLREEGVVKEADEELSVAMYEALCEMTKAWGMEHYEISNFAYPGFRSQHNCSYWLQKPYWGFGPGAHSYDGNTLRRWNLPDLKAYIQSPTTPHQGETLTPKEQYEELVFTRLRMKEGLSLDLLQPHDASYCLRMAAPHIQNGMLVLDKNTLRLHPKAIFVSDDIISDLMY